MPKSVTNDNWQNVYIPYFRGVSMRTTLPTEGIHRNESGIINLDNAEGPGSPLGEIVLVF